MACQKTKYQPIADTMWISQVLMGSDFSKYVGDIQVVTHDSMVTGARFRASGGLKSWVEIFNFFAVKLFPKSEMRLSPRGKFGLPDVGPFALMDCPRQVTRGRSEVREQGSTIDAHKVKLFPQGLAGVLGYTNLKGSGVLLLARLAI